MRATTHWRACDVLGGVALLKCVWSGRATMTAARALLSARAHSATPNAAGGNVSRFCEVEGRGARARLDAGAEVRRDGDPVARLRRR
jgi:hypothetical protein